ncbi:MAG: hypothetical protein EXR44_06015 [Dehalococcoidia bacterium]|nr:hypothetical protein [Dehalococcoidia bacterium]
MTVTQECWINFNWNVSGRRHMWTDYRNAPNLMIAEMWKNLLEGEGLPAKIVPEGDILDWGERVPFRVLVPKGREHVADEILRKL